MSNRGYRPPSRPSSAEGWRQGGGGYGYGSGYGGRDSRQSNRPPLSPGAHFYQQDPYRESSPALAYGGNGNGYGFPELQYGEAPTSIGPPRSEVDYEERDLGEIANQNQARQEREWRQGPEAGIPYQEESNPYHPQSNEWGQPHQPYPPPRSSYSSPPPRHSLEVGSVYGFYSEPPQPSADYYRGGPMPGPASIASSGRTFGSGPGKGVPRRPSSQPPSTPYSTRDEAAPRFFDVNAPHHSPGNRRSLPLNAGAGGARDPHPYATGGEENDMYGDPLPAFPSWSRNWYGGHLSADGHAYTQVPPPPGAQSGWESETLTHSGGGGPHRGYHYGRTAGEEGITDYVKEERMRMLEKEFGPKIKHNGKGEEEEEEEELEEEELVMGSVDRNGRLVLPRPRTRKAIRWCQGLISLVAVGCGIGGVLLIKPAANDKPAASGTVPSYVLYAASVIALLVTLYLFVFRPCCCNPMKKQDQAGAGANNPMAGMVIPVMGGPNGDGKKNKKFKKGKKGMMMGGGGTTVNLIVDPSMLGKREESSSEDEDELLPGEGRKKKKKRKSKGLGMMENMRLQARWQLARKFVKVVTAWDCVLFLLWGAAAIMTLAIGKSCPPGSSKGWCDLYNGAIACSVLGAVLALIAIYFDFQDLKISKSPPKASL